jgi:Carboxypeptidase regulatory-like domain
MEVDVRHKLISLIAVLALCLIAPVAWTQVQATASLVGHVTDATGSPIANVNISATSPALQVQQVHTTSDSNGDYQILNLPAPGIYRVQFEMQGFEMYVQNDVHLGIGFAGRVDAAMHIGAVTQSVEVSGATPVVDTVNTSNTSSLQLQEIVDTPRGLTMQELLPQAQGVSMNGRPDVGDSNLAQRQAIVTYGLVLEPTMSIEGINVTTSHDEDTAVYFDSFSLGEVAFNSSGNNADVAFPGVDMVAQFKSGSNSFHGDAEYDVEKQPFQSNNVSPALSSQGVTTTNPLAASGFNDYMADYGGRIIRDKLWFYGETSREVQDSGSFGFHSGPDAAGCWTCVDAPIAYIGTHLTTVMGKGDYQIKPTIKLIGTYQYALKFLSAQGASATEELSAVQYQTQPGSLWKGEIQWTPTQRLYVDALAGWGGYHVHYVTVPAAAMQAYGNYSAKAPNTDFAGDPSEEDLNTSLLTGPTSGPNDRPQNRVQARGLLGYIRGQHQFKFGSDDTWEEAHTAVLSNNKAGDYLLLFKGAPAGCNGACGALVNGSEITLYNYPVLPSNFLYSQSLFATDTWTLKHLVLNYGIRWERYNNFYPTETKPTGQFANLFPSANYPGKGVLSWNDFVPRVGGAWDLRGDGKTVVKASFGIFRDTMGDLYANQMNPNTISSETFKWDSTVSQSCYNDPGVTSAFYYDEYACDVNPAYLTTLNSATPPTPLSTSGAIFQLNNPNLKQPIFYEYTVRVERQLAKNIAVNFGYIRHSAYYLYDSANSPGADLASNAATTSFTGNGIAVGHAYSDYSIPVTYNETGNGSSYLPGSITLYTYAKGTGEVTCGGVVGSCTEYLNNPSARPDIYNTLEASVVKRYSTRFNAMGYFWVTKYHRWINGLVGMDGDPNNDLFPVDNTWNWEARAAVTYNAPYGFKVNSFLRMQSGVYGQEVGTFSGTGTNGNALNQGSVTVRLGPYGQFQGPGIPVWNFEVSRVTHFRERFQFEPDFEMFNITNSAAATSSSYKLGSTFNEVTGILAPRIFRIGIKGQF